MWSRGRLEYHQNDKYSKDPGDSYSVKKFPYFLPEINVTNQPGKLKNTKP